MIERWADFERIARRRAFFRRAALALYAAAGLAALCISLRVSP